MHCKTGDTSGKDFGMGLKYEYELIVWRDHAGCNSNWMEDHHYVEDNWRPLEIHSCGVVIQETDDHVIVAAHTGENMDGDRVSVGSMCIIKSTIIKRKQLK